MKPDPLMSLDKYFRQCVCIDISKDKFTACLFMYDRGGEVGCCTESIDFPQSKTGFNQLVKWSRREAQKGFPMPFLMEPTSTYYEKLAYHLHKIGKTVRICNSFYSETGGLQIRLKKVFPPPSNTSETTIPSAARRCLQTDSPCHYS